jgi:phage terminase large subunit-like protein
MTDLREALTERARREQERRAAIAEQQTAAEDDLLAFVRMFWHVLEPEKTLIEGWVLDLLCDVMMAVADGHMTRVSINVPPGSMKSSLLNVFFPAWEWGPQNMPHMRYLSASYSTAIPERDNIRFARVINDPVYQRCWGDRVHLVRAGTELVENARGGWKRVASTGGGTTGWRANRLLLDDLNNPMNVESEDVRRATERFVREIMPDRLNDLDEDAIINLQQRTHAGDATGLLLKYGQGYEFVCVPMEFDPLRIYPVTLRRDERGKPEQVWTDPRGLDAAGNTLAGLYTDRRGELKVRIGSPMAKAEGALCWPERFSPDAVAKLKAEKGPYAWDCNPGEAPILMADLSTKALRDVRIGDEVVGFETGCEPLRDGANFVRRRLINTVVTDIHRDVRPVVKLALDSGQSIRCTPNHKWYTGRAPNDPTHPVYAAAKVGRALLRVCDPALPALDTLEDARMAGWVFGYNWVGGFYIRDQDKIVALEPDGEDVVYGLTTRTGNYVAWGFGSSNSQYQQFPGVRGGGIIRRDWWHLWPDETWPELGTILVSVDTATEEGPKNDWNACTAWGAFAGDAGEPLLLLIEAWRARCPLAELVAKVETTCRRRKADYLLIEHKTRGRDLHDEIIRIYQHAAWQTVLVDVEISKAARLKAVQGLFSGDYSRDPNTGVESYTGGMIYAPDKAWADEVITEVAEFPWGEKDDYCDSVSQALGWVRKNGVVLRRVEYDEAELDRKRFRKTPGVPYAIKRT